MAIKFRCRHCRQYLGISRSKAGTVVDCPTCGRSIRVPQLDGSVDPVPIPEWNLDDSELVQALGELASIGTQPVDGSEAERKGQAADSDEQPVAVVPEPEPIDLPLPASAQVVTSAVEPQTSGTAPSRAGLSSGSASSDALASLAASSPNSVTFARTSSATTAHRFSPRAMTSGVLLLAPVIAAVFWAGYRLGQQANEPSGGQDSALNASAEPDAAPVPKEPLPQLATSAIQGRITYNTESGESRPDRGARVIVLPETRLGDIKLSVVGLRPGDAQADFQVTAAALRALGGDAAIVDDAGNYTIELADPGKYQILALSHYQAREENPPSDPELTSVLSEFFDGAPDQLLGHVQYHAASLRYNGGRTMTWDYSFENP